MLVKASHANKDSTAEAKPKCIGSGRTPKTMLRGTDRAAATIPSGLTKPQIQKYILLLRFIT